MLCTAELEMSLDFLRAGEKEECCLTEKIIVLTLVSFVMSEGKQSIRNFLWVRKKDKVEYWEKHNKIK